MARLKYNAQLEQALQDEEDDYTGEPTSSSLLLSCTAVVAAAGV
jgi:hypothetical protein